MKSYLLLSLVGAVAVGVTPPGGKRELREFLGTPAAPNGDPGAFVSPAEGEAIIAEHPGKFIWAEPLPAEEVQALAAKATLEVVQALAAKAKVEVPKAEVAILGDLQDTPADAPAEAAPEAPAETPEA